MSKLKRGELARLVLGVIGVTGIVFVGALAPGVLQAIAPLVRKRYPYEGIRQVIHRLDKRGRIILRQTGSGWRVNLTRRGKSELLAYELGEKLIKKPRRWDKRWHLLIFDVPESHRSARDKIRHTLKTLNFYRLQDSVWVYPYECRDVLDLLRTGYGIRAEALYVKAEEISEDQWLRKHFGLK